MMCANLVYGPLMLCRIPAGVPRNRHDYWLHTSVAVVVVVKVAPTCYLQVSVCLPPSTPFYSDMNIK
jgi:hypothetical protein